MKPEHEFKSEESRQREAAHWFGAPNGNPTGNPKVAANQRLFYKWCEAQATEEELRAYVLDESKPYARRRFVASLVKCETVQDFFDLTNQTHGQPKQVIEQTNLPAIEIVLE